MWPSWPSWRFSTHRSHPRDVITTDPAPDCALLDDALEAGADGFVLERATLERLIDGIRTMAEGLSSAEIAGRVRLSPETVQPHVRSILAELGVRDGTLAVVWAYRTGFVDPSAGDDQRRRPLAPSPRRGPVRGRAGPASRRGRAG